MTARRTDGHPRGPTPGRFEPGTDPRTETRDPHSVTLFTGACGVCRVDSPPAAPFNCLLNTAPRDPARQPEAGYPTNTTTSPTVAQNTTPGFLREVHAWFLAG